MKIARHNDMIVNGRPFYSWYEGKDGTHVPLPLDVSQVSDAVVEKVAEALWREQSGGYKQSWHMKCEAHKEQYAATARAAIAALAAALGKEG
jgi:hypothetical protein